MRAVLCKSYGGPEELVVEEVPKPQPGPGEVLIAVKAAALNFFDTLIIRNKYQYQPDLPFSPSAEIAGVVEEVGQDCKHVKAGDRVVVYLRWGGCRDYVLVSEKDAIVMPDGLAFEKAAGLMVTYGTTLYGLKNRAKLQREESLAVLGAAGGVGQAAIEIGKLMGARVIACASSQEKLEFCRSFGADDCINYKREDLKLTLKELTDGRGVDVVYDPVGGDLAEAALRATGWYGRFLVVGFASGTITKMPLNLVMLKGVDVLGVFWGEAVIREPNEHAENVRQLLDWVAKGNLVPHIHQTYALEDTPKALAAIANREVKGKVIITP
ncbi:MAG: NADPH:quinone oxidoreductase family protein [Cohaesibacter sp.]|nr:NADPH:quinone oxidoreductase family protein [Cohaesibacter sp.]MCV6601451.1 NADPH:quinone oxidoreductase family protein [Cohaesibacter sp.]